RGQDAEEVAVAEEDDSAAGRFQASDDAVGPGADRVHRLTAGTAVAEQVPPGPLRANFGGGPALVCAVVPLQQVGLGSGTGTEPGQLARPASPPERADEDEFERLPLQSLAQAPGVGFPARGQRDIGPARVLVRDRPCRLAVPCQVDSWERFAHGLTL